MTRMLPAIVVFASILLDGARAGAQQQDPPRLSIAGGAGVALPLHADLDFTPSEWQVSFRGRFSRHFALEGFLSDWRHDATRVLINQSIEGPTGFLGRVGRIEETTSHDVRVVGVNALATGSRGRVTIAGGGGIGILLFDRRFRQTSTGCNAGTTALCGTFENTFTNDSETVQGVVDIDVAVTRRLSGFGRYQVVLPLRDIGFGHGSVAGGVRLTLW